MDCSMLACQAPLSSTISWSLLKFMTTELVMLSNHLILCHSLVLLLSIFPSLRVFSNELVLHIRWPKYWRNTLAFPSLTNLDSILKSRDITLSTKVRLVKAMVFPMVMYGCESWTVKKTEHRRIDAFELWCWRRLLRVPWTARRSNQSILKEISPGCSMEGLMLTLKL